MSIEQKFKQLNTGPHMCGGIYAACVLFIEEMI